MEVTMDPRDFDRIDRRVELDRGLGTSTSPWGWIAGAVFIIALLALIFASSDSTQTARNDMTKPGPTTSTPLTAPPAMPPAQPPSTTGQGTR
jgi:hypothetical protein